VITLVTLLFSVNAPTLVAQAPAKQEPTAAAEEILNNQAVLDMVKAGMSDDLVITKIKTSKTSFDTSTAALQDLKKAGLSDPVLTAMVAAAVNPLATTPTHTTGEPAEVKVPDGTEIEIELRTNVSGQASKVGDIVDFVVVKPVQVNGVVIVDQGASARAKITTAKKAGYWGKAGKLEWAIQDVMAIDGNRVPARFTKRQTGDSKGGTVAVAAVATTVLLGPVGLLWGLKKGKAAVIPAGNRYTIFIQGDTTIKGLIPAKPTE
jgi:hypothetical protein